jgi:hypothetical protein
MKSKSYLLKEGNELKIYDDDIFYISSNSDIISINVNLDFDIESINFKEINNLIYRNKPAIHVVNFKDGFVHNSNGVGWLIYSDEEDEKIKYYFFNGIEYKYEQWLELPERIREVRDEKIKLL